jgi:hypothetical protein
VVDGDADGAGAFLDLQRPIGDADHRTEREISALMETPQAKEVSEQLTGATYNVNYHGGLIRGPAGER